MKKMLGLIGLLWLAGFFHYIGPVCASQTVSGDQAPTRLILAGSGSNLHLTRILAHRFMQTHPGVLIEIPESIGSRGAIKAIVDGAITLGLISRALKGEENDLGLTVMPYARTGIVLGVHPSVSESDITFEEIVDIYNGVKSRWKEGQEIIVLTREPGDSSIEVLEKIVPGFKEAYAQSWKNKRWTALFTDQEMEKTLIKVPYAIGFSDTVRGEGEISQIKALTLKGISPSPENLANGNYPFLKTLSFVYLKNKLPEEARSFLEFVRSDEAASVMRNAGCLPSE